MYHVTTVFSQKKDPCPRILCNARDNVLSCTISLQLLGCQPSSSSLPTIPDLIYPYRMKWEGLLSCVYLLSWWLPPCMILTHCFLVLQTNASSYNWTCHLFFSKPSVCSLTGIFHISFMLHFPQWPHGLSLMETADLKWLSLASDWNFQRIDLHHKNRKELHELRQ